MKTALKVFSAFIVLLIVAAVIPALIPDEAYLPGAEQWLKDANKVEDLPVEVNSFNAIAGMWLETDKDNVVEGARLIADVNDAFRRYDAGNMDISPFNPYWNKPPLKVSSNLTSSTTAAYKKNPVQWLSDNRDSYAALINSNQVLLDRFKKLMTMKQYSRTMRLDINAPSISYSNFLSIKRLNNLSIIYEFITADKQDAVNRLKQNISFSRLMMKQSSNLLAKMIAAELLTVDLYTYSALLDILPVHDTLRVDIENLRPNERTMSNVFKGEFAYLSSALDIEKGYRFGNNFVEPSVAESFLMSQYLKPKTLDNKSYKEIWLPFLDLENHPLAGREIKASVIGEKQLTWWQIYQDPLGYFLFNIATPSYYKYIDRIDHVDATITLLNLKASIVFNKVLSGSIGSYLDSAKPKMNKGYTGAKVFWDKAKHELSYEIPDYKDEGIPRIKLLLRKRGKNDRKVRFRK